MLEGSQIDAMILEIIDMLMKRRGRRFVRALLLYGMCWPKLLG